MPPRRLLTVGHSYCVGLNRRLAHELARAGGGEWDVTVAGPAFFRGDLRPVAFEPQSDEPCRVEPVPARLTGRVHVMLYGRRLRQLLRESWDVVHAWEEPYVLSGGQISFHTPAGAKLVFATFQNIAKTYPPPFRWVERYALRRASGWVAFGRLVEDTLRDHPGYRSRPHRVIPPGVDVDRFRPDPARLRDVLARLGWAADGPPVVGYLGRLVPEKGLDDLMTALDAVRSPWRALVVGTGPLEPIVRAWGAGHGDRVRVLTDVSHDGVPPVLNAMDVLAAPSRTTPRWREQLGRMLLEAFASGVSVVGSDSGEIPYVVGDAGVIVPEADPAAWADALGRLIDSPAARADLAARGRDRAERVFAWPVVAREHLRFFEELTSARPETDP